MELCPKALAIPMLVRTMCPDVIITDEIGGEKDALALAEASRCGVAVIASAHASSYDELIKLGSLESVMRAKVFGCVLMLRRSGSLLRITRVKP